jgi:hypothetical protein
MVLWVERGAGRGRTNYQPENRRSNSYWMVVLQQYRPTAGTCTEPKKTNNALISIKSQKLPAKSYFDTIIIHRVNAI